MVEEVAWKVFAVLVVAYLLFGWLDAGMGENIKVTWGRKKRVVWGFVKYFFYSYFYYVFGLGYGWLG